MAISTRAEGTWVSGSTTQNTQVAFPAGYTPIAGDIGIIVSVWKPFGTTATVDQGWSELFDLATGSTANGNGAGSLRLYAATKIFTASGAQTAPTISRSTAPAPSASVMIVLQKAANEAWEIVHLSNATEQAMGSTAMSHVCSTIAGITSGAWVFALTGVADDSATFTRATTAISGGPTWSGDRVEYPATHLSTTDSNDLAADLIYRVASSTVASGQSITVTATLTAAERVGSALFSIRAKAATQTSVAEVSLASASTPSVRGYHALNVRARVTSGIGATMRMALYEGANNRSGDLESAVLTTSLADYSLPISAANATNITDYSNLGVRFWGYDAYAGAATVFEVDQIWLELPEGTGESHDASVVTTGGGVATVSSAKRGQLTYVATGGGVLTPSSVTVRTRTDVATGGGVTTVVQTTTRTSTVTVTGGGVLTPTSVTVRTATVTATGGGVATVDAEVEEIHTADITATGGGVATLSTTKRAEIALTGTGGGVATTIATTTRTSSVSVTGGGTATVVSPGIHAVTVTATGAGVATVVGAKRGELTLAATGGGVTTPVQTTVRTSSPEMTGGGVATVDGVNPGAGVVTASIVVTGGGVATVSATRTSVLELVATGGGVTTAVGVKRAETSHTATGGGVLTADLTTIRSASVAVTGGTTTIPIDAETWRLASVLVTGGGVATVSGGPFTPGQPGSSSGSLDPLGSSSGRILVGTASGSVRQRDPSSERVLVGSSSGSVTPLGGSE